MRCVWLYRTTVHSFPISNSIFVKFKCKLKSKYYICYRNALMAIPWGKFEFILYKVVDCKSIFLIILRSLIFHSLGEYKLWQYT